MAEPRYRIWMPVYGNCVALNHHSKKLEGPAIARSIEGVNLGALRVLSFRQSLT